MSAILSLSRRTFARRIAGCAAGLLLAFVTVPPARAEVGKEYKIKAAFLYNFTKFVEWPASRFADDNAPIIIGVVGTSPVGNELAAMLRSRKVNGRCVVARAIRSADDLAPVHVVFVPSGEEETFKAVAGARPPNGVLTVGESHGFTAAGGMISFTNVGDKVRFEINVESAERAGLKISAQLQKLATVVRKKSRGLP